MENIFDVQKILNRYDSIDLKEMDEVKLMNRTDTKYTFMRDKLPCILNQLGDDYRVLEVENNRISGYETLYFDTPTYNLYLQHHNLKLNRYKVRYRHYTSSGSSFFEIKVKNNKNRTIKERISTDCIKNYIEDDGINMIDNGTPINSSSLVPAIWVYYSRITLVNRFDKERLTLDTNLSFRENNKVVSFPNIVIAEVKQEKAYHSPFNLVMKNNYVRTSSISKYCFGIITLIDNIKMNNFKYKLMTIKKMCNGCD